MCLYSLSRTISTNWKECSLARSALKATKLVAIPEIFEQWQACVVQIVVLQPFPGVVYSGPALDVKLKILGSLLRVEEGYACPPIRCPLSPKDPTQGSFVRRLNTLIVVQE